MAIGNYLTCAEVADELGVSKGRVSQFVAEGRLKAHPVGRNLFFERSVVRKFAAQPRETGRPKKSAKNRQSAIAKG